MSMAVFELRPVPPKQRDASWSTSWHQQRCRVTAPSAHRARLWAASAFTVAAAQTAALNCPSAWLQTDLVEIADMQTVSAAPEGTVHVPDPTGPNFWFVVNAGHGAAPQLRASSADLNEAPFQAECQ